MIVVMLAVQAESGPIFGAGYPALEMLAFMGRQLFACMLALERHPGQIFGRCPHSRIKWQGSANEGLSFQFARRLSSARQNPFRRLAVRRRRLCRKAGDLVTRETELTMVERHIRNGERHVTRQKEIIEELKRKGLSVQASEELLAIFEALLGLHREQRARLVVELNERET